MIVELSPEVTENKDNFRDLDRLLLLFEDEKHEWYLRTGKEDVMDRAWTKQLSENHQKILAEIVEKAIVHSFNISKRELEERGVMTIETEGINVIGEVLKLLSEPLLIVVENETSDSKFLNRLYEIYPVPGKSLTAAVSKGMLSYYPAGGRNETVKTLKNLANKMSRPRLLVFIDSDKKYPGQPHDPTLQAISDYCEQNKIPLHILYKREIENYLPKEVLKKKLPDTLNKQLEVFLTLKPHQWDFYDLEKGFKNPPPENDPYYGEFSDRKDERYNALRSGFHINHEFIAKQQLYTFVDDENFNAINVNGRCSHQPDNSELLNLLKMIYKNL